MLETKACHAINQFINEKSRIMPFLRAAVCSDNEQVLA